MASLKVRKIALLSTLYIVVVLGFLAVLIIFSESDTYEKEKLGNDIIKACIMGLCVFVYDFIKLIKKAWSNKSKK